MSPQEYTYHYGHCHETRWKVEPHLLAGFPAAWKNKNEEDWGSHRTSEHQEGGPDIFTPAWDLKCFKRIYLLCVCVWYMVRGQKCVCSRGEQWWAAKCWPWELNVGPLLEQQALLPTAPSLWSPSLNSENTSGYIFRIIHFQAEELALSGKKKTTFMYTKIK